jgi:hypothetical protein
MPILNEVEQPDPVDGGGGRAKNEMSINLIPRSASVKTQIGIAGGVQKGERGLPIPKIHNVVQ